MYARNGIYTCGHAWKEEERGGLYYIIYVFVNKSDGVGIL